MLIVNTGIKYIDKRMNCLIVFIDILNIIVYCDIFYITKQVNFILNTY